MKNNIKQKVWIAIFLIFIFLPGFLQIISQGKWDIESSENRRLAEMPKFIINEYSSYATRFDEYATDHIFLKNRIIRMYAIFSYKVFNESITDNDLVGKDNNLLIGKGWGISGYNDVYNEYKNIRLYAGREMQTVVDGINYINDRLNEKGIKFIVCIPSNKEMIYREYYPEYVKVVEAENRCDSLVGYIEENSTVPIIYPKRKMEKYTGGLPLYYKYDTHWNLLGAYICEQQLLEYLGIVLPDLSDKKIYDEQLVYHPSAEDDLAREMSLVGCFEPDREYIIDGYPLLEDYNQEEFSSSNPIINQRILFAGDSFRNNVKTYIAKDFADSKVIYQYDLCESIVDEYKPDVVVLEYVDRGAIGLRDWMDKELWER